MWWMLRSGSLMDGQMLVVDVLMMVVVTVG
jgi:hypothetical protein